MRSNAMRGPYMRNIVDRTISEIHDNLVTVFGPYATDAFLTMNGQTYYTRDGKETLRLMRFDNELAMYILKIMYQAVQQQGEKVGDGTTTLAVFYTNLYQSIQSWMNLRKDHLFSRKIWNEAVSDIVNSIKTRSVPMEETDLLQMLYTCTQDDELATKIYVNLKDAIMANAYITINKSNIESDFVMTTHRAPQFKATRQFSVFPIKNQEDRCTILHCNGVLDIVHSETILDLMSRVDQYGSVESPSIRIAPKTVIILCNGVTEATRKTIKEVLKILNANKKSMQIDETSYNNVAIYTLDDYRKYDSEQIEDISTIITDEIGIGGLVNQLTFESLVYQSLGNNQVFIEDLARFDSDMHHIQKMRDIFNTTYPMEFDDVLGIRIHKELGPVAKARYEDLRKQIEEEKSGVKLVELNRRLRTMYGQFIEVEVGSKMMKDSQRKYELILDAVLSASEAVEKGILRVNSILTAIDVSYYLYEAADIDSVKCLYYNIINEALCKTLVDMLQNGDMAEELMEDTEVSQPCIIEWIRNGRPHLFNMNVRYFDDIIPRKNRPEPSRPEHTVKIEDNTVTFTEQIIEPVSIITTMLENSTLMLELAQAKVFQLESFMENHI